MFKRDMCDNLTESPIVFGRLHPRPGVSANRSRPALCQPIAELTAGRTILNQPMGAEAWTNGLGSCLMLTHWLGRMRLLLLLVSSLVAAGSAELTVIEEDGWRQLLKGEWMVELWVSFLLGCWRLYLLSSQSHDWFHTGKAVSSFIPSAAPWCPACRALQPTWEEFAGWSEDLEVFNSYLHLHLCSSNNWAETNCRWALARLMSPQVPVCPEDSWSPLSQQSFMWRCVLFFSSLITDHPPKDGVFRQYRGARDKDSFISFVEEKKWQVFRFKNIVCICLITFSKGVEPISEWKSPDSVQMSLVSYFFKLSMVLRNVHTVLTEDYQVGCFG